MDRLQRLKTEAKQAASCHGHSITSFVQLEGRWSACCRKCGMAVTVVSYPPPDQATTSGRAVVLDCPDYPLSVDVSEK